MYRAVVATGDDFESWRNAARPLALAKISPEDIVWQVKTGETGLFEGDPAPPAAADAQLSVPRNFVDLAQVVLRHPDPARFDLLYRLLIAVSRDRAILAARSDPLVARIEAMAREVNLAKARTDSNSETAWQALREAAAACTRCDLYKHATQVVFGEGPLDARLMFVGEQPGDQEDLQGHPFVGPAGQLFDRALGDAGIDRARAYVSNAVKHFKFEHRGKRRIHSKPDAGEIKACRWWIDQERALIKPPVIVALGATAAHSLLGRSVTISSLRDAPIALEDGSKCHVTVHPSFLLRIPEEDRAKEEYRAFVRDLKRAREAAET